MNTGQQATILVDGDLLEKIADDIKREYFDSWQFSKTVEDREEIHAKQSAVDSVVQRIREKAEAVLNGTAE